MSPSSKYLFYHSFPSQWHQGSKDRTKKGLLILRSILKYGILLTPEVIFFPRDALPSGKANVDLEVLQIRFCLTQLSSESLASHANKFGPFSVAFEHTPVRQLGAMPVVYIPPPIAAKESLFAEIGYAFVEKLAELQSLLIRLASAEKAVVNLGKEDTLKISLGPRTLRISGSTAKNFLEIVNSGNDSFVELSSAVQALSCMFYPVGPKLAGPSENPLQFYQEREWRVISDIRNDVGLMDARLSMEEIETLKDIDEGAEERAIKFDGRAEPYLDCCRVIREFCGTPVVQHIESIIVPSEAELPATELARACGYFGRIETLN